MLHGKSLRGAILFAAHLAILPTLRAEEQTPKTPARPGGGFWKCTEKSDVKGEFGGEDPIGLASGKHIATNCAIYRSHDGKVYCFSSLPSLEFLDSNPELLQKAQAFWNHEHPTSSKR